MTNADHLHQLRQGVEAWNSWRSRNIVKPNLVGADLYGKQLSAINLRGADLGKSNLILTNLSYADIAWANFKRALLRGANLEGASLYGSLLDGAFLQRAIFVNANLGETNFSGANLSGANLSDASIVNANLAEADLSGANLQGVNLRGANLCKANLCDANLAGAKLIDAQLDFCDITGANLWETQRSGWSIKKISCRNAFWDRQSEERIDYNADEFERLFSEKPKIVLRCPGGISQVDFLALPLVIGKIQNDYPENIIQIRSMQSDAGGASITIVIDSLSADSSENNDTNLIDIKHQLEQALDEKGFLRHILSKSVSEISEKINNFLLYPRQEIHINHPTGLTSFGGGLMARDIYNISGQAGAVGPNAAAYENIYQQNQSEIDTLRLAEELGRLRYAMKIEGVGSRENDKEIGTIADAEEAAAKGDKYTAMLHLKKAGAWSLQVAEKIGVDVATEALKKIL